MQPLLQWKSYKILHTLGVCVLALGIQYSMCIRYIVLCRLPGSKIFFHIISQTARFSKEKVIEHEIGGFISSTTFV